MNDDVLSKSRVFVSREETGMTTIDWMNDGCAIFTLTTLTPIPNWSKLLWIETYIDN